MKLAKNPKNTHEYIGKQDNFCGTIKILDKIWYISNHKRQYFIVILTQAIYRSQNFLGDIL